MLIEVGMGWGEWFKSEIVVDSVGQYVGGGGWRQVPFEETWLWKEGETLIYQYEFPAP